MNKSKLAMLSGMLGLAADAYSQKFSKDGSSVYMEEQSISTDNIPKHSDKALLLSREHKSETEFCIQGHKIMAYSRKDAITRLTAQGLISRKKKKKK